MSTPRRRAGPNAVIRALVAVWAVAAPAAACAQTANWPSGPMRIVSPYPPGGGTDIMARSLAPRLNERLGQPVVVDNRAGANGTIGAAVVAKAPPDGLTMLIVPAGHASTPALYRNLPYDHARDLAPVSHLASGPLVLVVHPSLPAKSVRELVALARSRPGEVNCGSSGTGSLPHMSLELFTTSSGVKLNHIPYKGSGAATVDLLSGQVPVYFMNILQSLPLIKGGRVRALGVTSPARTPIAPDIPSIAEAGVKGFDMTNWYGMLVPGATPPDIVDRLQREVTRVLTQPDMKERLAADGMVVVAGTAAQFAEFLARETAKFNRIIQTAGIKGV